jgi:hypothetical protein
MRRLGKVFRGSHLVQARGGINGSTENAGEAARFHPGVIAFHIPDLIFRPTLKGWWKDGSLEEFYQSAKVIVLKNEGFQTAMSPEAEEENLFSIRPLRNISGELVNLFRGWWGRVFRAAAPFLAPGANPIGHLVQIQSGTCTW